MKKMFVISISLATLIGILFTQRDAFRGLFRSPTAYAVGDLLVNWGVPIGQPLFTIANSKPGDTFSKTVTISNGASSARPIAIRGIKTSETGIIANVLTIRISQNSVDLYGGSMGEKTLAQFFAEASGVSGIPLSSIEPGVSKNYLISVHFKNSAGNQYQNKNIIFDLHIGIAFDIPESCKNISFSGTPIFGTEGKNNLLGTNGNDLILAFEGNDFVDGGNGNDCILGGSGEDILSGGNGEDVIVDSEGNNKVDGGNGADILFLGNGNDYIQGGNANDLIYAGAGNDTINSGNGYDHVYGEDNDDKIFLENGDDVGDGGLGIDSIHGGNGIDTCKSELRVYCEL